MKTGKAVVRIATMPIVLVAINMSTVIFNLVGLVANQRAGRSEMVALQTVVVAAVSLGLALSLARTRVIHEELREAKLKTEFAANMLSKLKSADAVTLHGPRSDDDDDTPFGQRH